MILEGWKRDAEKLVSYLPTDTPAATRTGQLLHSVPPKGIEIDANIFDVPTSIYVSPRLFLIADRINLSQSKSVLGRMALTSPGVAFVAHGEGLPTVLTLPTHDPTKPLGNASILLHEFEHITEKEEGFGEASVGIREQRAYQTNIGIMTSLDGSDFQSYIDSWPVDYKQTTISITPQIVDSSASISFSDTTCPEPPKETFLHDMWNEDGSSRQMLQSIGRAAVFEKLTASLDKSLVNKLADGIHS